MSDVRLITDPIDSEIVGDRQANMQLLINSTLCNTLAII